MTTCAHTLCIGIGGGQKRRDRTKKKKKKMSSNIRTHARPMRVRTQSREEEKNE
jgi:hypothetical protein